MAAAALMSGAYLGPGYALAVPVASMLVSDWVIGFYAWPVMLAVYVSFALSGLLGLSIRRIRQLETVVGASLLASTLFFLLTNFAVWRFTTMYPATFIGLLASYTAGLPFFRNTLVGDLAYTVLLYGLFVLSVEKQDFVRRVFFRRQIVPSQSRNQ